MSEVAPKQALSPVDVLVVGDCAAARLAAEVSRCMRGHVAVVLHRIRKAADVAAWLANQRADIALFDGGEADAEVCGWLVTWKVVAPRTAFVAVVPGVGSSASRRLVAAGARTVISDEPHLESAHLSELVTDLAWLRRVSAKRSRRVTDSALSPTKSRP